MSQAPFSNGKLTENVVIGLHDFNDGTSAAKSVAVDPSNGVPLDVSAPSVVKDVSDSPIVGTMAAGINNVIGPFDMTGYNAISVTFTDVGSNNSVICENHDDANAASWFPATIASGSSANTGPQANVPSVGVYVVPRRARFVRFRNTGTGTGTVTMIGNRQTTVPTFPSIGVGGSVFGNTSDLESSANPSATSATMISLLKKQVSLLEAIRAK